MSGVRRGCWLVTAVLLPLVAACAGPPSAALSRPDDYPAPIALCPSPGPDPSAALRAAHRACLEELCLAEAPAACTQLGEVYRVAEEPVRDPALAALLYRRACELGDAAGCHHLANLYMVGDGVPQEPERALPIYQRLCAAELPTVCQVLGYLYETGHGGIAIDLDAARRYYGAACAGGFAHGCERLRALDRRLAEGR